MLGTQWICRRVLENIANPENGFSWVDVHVRGIESILCTEPLFYIHYEVIYDAFLALAFITSFLKFT